MNLLLNCLYNTIFTAAKASQHSIRFSVFELVDITREPRARDSGAKGGTGTREYWWETPTRGSTGGEHYQEVPMGNTTREF